jgi:TRAP-type C4-dicarboxylate transport system substrate-binding protein
MIRANHHLEPLTTEKGGKGIMKGKGLSCLVAVALLVGIVGFSLPPAEVQAKPTIKVIFAWPKPVNWNRGHEQLVGMFQEALSDRVNFLPVGGPEVVPTFQQGEAVRNGVVDMYMGAINYYSGQIPAVDTMKLFKIPPWEARKKGLFDYIDKLHAKKLNAHFIGQSIPHNVQFHLYTMKPAKKRADFKGRVIRVTAIYRSFVESMGGAPTIIPPPEVYTALQRGTVDGLGWPSIGVRDLKWDEVLKYRIDPGFYGLDGAVTINLDKWNSLPKDVQDSMTKIVQKYERMQWTYWEAAVAREPQELEKRGVKVIQLPPDEAKKYVAQAYKVAWDELLKKRAPKEAAAIKALLEK